MTTTEAAILAFQANRDRRLAAYTRMRHYPRTEAARILGVTTRTIQRYEATLKHQETPA